MPTGYTCDIKDGISFEKFALICARAFGACISMREDSLDTPIPEELTPSDYHEKQIKKAELELEELKAMSMEDAQEKAKKEWQSEWDNHRRIIDENAKLRRLYEDMLMNVYCWTPPTTEHNGLKKFMEEQILSSIDFDCYEPTRPMDSPMCGDEWLSKQIEKTEEDIEYHRKKHKEEIERTSSRNMWIKQLRESLK